MSSPGVPAGTACTGSPSGCRRLVEKAVQSLRYEALAPLAHGLVRRPAPTGDIGAEELKAAEELRTQAEDLLFRTFYRALKARSMMHPNPVPVQVIRPDTFLRPDDQGHSHATRAWNLATSLLYKSGHEPWRPAELPANTCYIGISFHHLKRREGDVVYASLAQAFSNEIEPFALKGALVPHDQRRDRQPYLTDAQAAALMTEVLDKYETLAGMPPTRVVVHKTSTYPARGGKGVPCGRCAHLSLRSRLDAEYRVSPHSKGDARALARHALHVRQRVVPVHNGIRLLVPSPRRIDHKGLASRIKV